jgi:replicative DNA helicase
MTQPNRQPQSKQSKITVLEPDKLPSEEVEKACVGSVLINPKAFLKLNTILDDGRAFHMPRYRYIWEAMLHLHQNELDIDTLTVCQILGDRGVLKDIGGPAQLTMLINDTPTSVHAETYARMLGRIHSRYQMMWLADEIKEASRQENVSMENILATIQNKHDSVMDDVSRRLITTTTDYANDHLDKTNAILDSGQQPKGIATGINGFDKIIGKLFPGLYLFAGRVHNGKTITLMTIALNAVLSGHKVLYINNADGDGATVFNMFLSMLTGMHRTMLQRRTWGDDKKDTYMNGLSRINNLGLFIEHQDGITPKMIQSKAALIKRQHGLDMIVVDYIQNCGVGAEGVKVYPNKKMQMDYVSESFKSMRKQFDIPIVYGAQLHRQASDDVKPSTAHIQDSSKIGMDADVIALLWQQDKQRRELTISVEKNRVMNIFDSFRVPFNPVTGQVAR